MSFCVSGDRRRRCIAIEYPVAFLTGLSRQVPDSRSGTCSGQSPSETQCLVPLARSLSFRHGHSRRQKRTCRHVKHGRETSARSGLPPLTLAHSNLRFRPSPGECPQRPECDIGHRRHVRGQMASPAAEVPCHFLVNPVARQHRADPFGSGAGAIDAWHGGPAAGRSRGPPPLFGCARGPVPGRAGGAIPCW